MDSNIFSATPWSDGEESEREAVVNSWHRPSRPSLQLPDGPDHHFLGPAHHASAEFPVPADAGVAGPLQPLVNFTEDAEADSSQMAPPGPPRRSKYGNLDWDRHKATLKRLYIIEDKPLTEVMRIMEEQYSFKASTKLYKSKFDIWGWPKNLPTRIARFFVAKGTKRKLDSGSDTIFTYHNRVWDETHIASTAKRSKTNSGPIDLATPEGVTYRTPRNAMLSPSENEEDETSQESDSSEADALRHSATENLEDFWSLSWNGLSRSELLAMGETARRRSQENDSEEAERLYLDVLAGLTQLQGAANEETAKVAFALADLYVQLGRIPDADAVIETSIRKHVEAWGRGDKRTQQHVLHVVELLNGWNRHEDALGLLSRFKEIMSSSEVKGRRLNSRRSAGKRDRKGKRKEVERPSADNAYPELHDMERSIEKDQSAGQMSIALGVARPHVASKNNAVEHLLRAMIRLCEASPRALSTQHMHAWAELLSLYEKLGQVSVHTDAFAYAQLALDAAWIVYEWDEKKFQCFEFMEASLQLVANMLKCKFASQARRLFRRIADKAASLYGPEEERSVWVLITIGLVYQTHVGWEAASEWFQEAFSNALANKAWGEKDGIVMSLQQALDNKHFTYLSDEGRPFKSIFGVTGITIRPGRLHLG